VSFIREAFNERALENTKMDDPTIQFGPLRSIKPFILLWRQRIHGKRNGWPIAVNSESFLWPKRIYSAAITGNSMLLASSGA
jgi:hypothetical protein